MSKLRLPFSESFFLPCNWICIQILLSLWSIKDLTYIRSSFVIFFNILRVLKRFSAFHSFPVSNNCVWETIWSFKFDSLRLTLVAMIFLISTSEFRSDYNFITLIKLWNELPKIFLVSFYILTAFTNLFNYV